MKNLKELCDKVEEITYSRKLSDSEISELKHELSENCIKIAVEEDRFSVLKTTHKEILKPLLLEKDETIDLLKTKVKLVTEECNVIFNYETNMAEIYSADGEMVGRRPLTSDEMQKTIQFELRTGTND